MERKALILADDHEVVRSGTRLHLEGVKWLSIVGEAATGPEALRCVASARRFLDPGLAADLLCPGVRALSPREREILEMMSLGRQNGGIAFELEISVDTVKTHVSHILDKLDAQSRTEAVASALRRAIIE